MGGCRCTYKNCSVRSDGKTHLFHFPVFDKVRCHEWLSKAGRYDFLNLKVSQLKNRCICQHHFADEWFMNDKKEKLKAQAVPTLDGPYCDSSKFKDTGMPQNMVDVYPLACEVIENDDFLDRKSNYNVVYADFLTNAEGMDTLKDHVNSTDAMDQSKNMIDIENVIPITNNNITEAGYKLRSAIDNKLKPPQPPPSALFVEIPPLSAEQNNANVKNKIKTEDPQLPLIQNNVNITHNLPTQKVRNKVRIISEKKITDPGKRISVPVTNASFKVVKPSMILNFSSNKAKSKANGAHLKDKEVHTVIHIESEKKVEPIIDKKGESEITEMLSSSDPSKFDVKIDIIESNPLGKLETNQKKMFTHKMSQERIDAINEKRKFNMKIKDIIAEELNRLDEPNLADRGTLIPRKLNNKKLGTKTVMSSLSSDPSLPNEHAYIVHYLEARMEKMENLLLQKIDQNTKKIMDLKRSLDTQEENLPDSKKLTKEPNLSGDAHKKYLFNEISQYLTLNSKSLIYEELFINKYIPNEHKADLAPSTSKRKRNRR